MAYLVILTAVGATFSAHLYGYMNDLCGYTEYINHTTNFRELVQKTDLFVAHLYGYMNDLCGYTENMNHTTHFREFIQKTHLYVGEPAQELLDGTPCYYVDIRLFPS